MTGSVAPAGAELTTRRLRLRPWRVEDAPAALEIYGAEHRTAWSVPGTPPVRDVATMRTVLMGWKDAHSAPPSGRWAVDQTSDGALVGGVSLRVLPPRGTDLGISWELTRAAQLSDYPDEVVFALAAHAFSHDVDEVFALVRPESPAGSDAVRRTGMQWVGETTKYYNRAVRLYRLRASDLS